MRNHNDHQTAITGLGCICSAGCDTDTLWQNLSQRTVNCRQTPDPLFGPGWSAPLFSVENAWLERPLELFTLHGLAANRTIQLTLQAIHEAMVEAGLSLEFLQTQRVGIALGTTVGCSFNNETYYADWREGNTPEQAPIRQYLEANLAETVQRILGIVGPRAVITNACASGTDAIGLAKIWLEQDLCDLVLAGGADEISRLACHGFSSLMLFSQKPCRPFDQGRDGLNLGEGAGILVMEKEATARQRHATILARVKGYGAAGDAYHPTAPHPQGRGLQQAIRQAMAEAEISVRDIALINAHGTGTRANDQAETTALHALGFQATQPAIISTKGLTGHTLGAAGAIEAILTILALNHGYTTGTTGCSTPDPQLPVTILPESARATLTGSLGLSQSLAFGGNNAALVLAGREE
ncbi:MAG: beta-ketoacyl-[acyl-carrier-protein] synthase family protein [Desulfoprunum sp.]|nr:beta-ketoacyl-[acyl-carrier-protein] synthase family protein [Desulfoprunum sp.]